MWKTLFIMNYLCVDMASEEKQAQELNSLRNISDSFKKQHRSGARQLRTGMFATVPFCIPIQ